jgi:ElaB/YqjD/DUF883 family membrane-anchored ribosome-binding protein
MLRATSARCANGNYKQSAEYARKVAASVSEDIKDDLDALRKDAAKLREQLAKLVSATGREGWDHAKDNVDDVISGAQDKGRHAIDAIAGMRGKIVSAFEDSIERRPYMVLAVALAIGVAVGAMRTRD